MPNAFPLTAGQKGDVPQAAALLEGRQADIVMADTAYDANHTFSDRIARAGAVAVTPDNPSRSIKLALDQELYKEHHLVECYFSKLKQFRRVATRYEKTAQKLPRHHYNRSDYPMDQITVHRT